MTAIFNQAPTLAPATLHGKKLIWLAHLGPALLTVFFIWLPFGFALTGLLEEWGVVGLFSRVGVFFLTDAASAMPAHALRPLTILPHAIAYSLDPNSFNYWHVLLIIALVIKGWAASVITTRITGAIKWGMLASVLVIVFPADTMQLSFRSIHINWALSLVLLASVLLIRALDERNRVKSLILSALASLILAASCAMYEVALLLAAIPAFVVFIQVGIKGIAAHIKRFYCQHLIWAVGPAAYIIYVIHTLPLVHSYQSAVVGDSALASVKMYFPKLFTLGVKRSVFGGWIDAFRITGSEIGSYWYVTVATALLLALIAFAAWKSKDTLLVETGSNSRWTLPVRMIAIGLVLICLGYLPFIFNPAHMAVSQRTFLYAAPGATMIFIALLLCIYRYSKTATATLSAMLIFTGLSAQLFQFQHYIEISKRQQSILNDIAHNFDGNAVGKTLLILDYSNQLNHDWMFLNPDLSAILFHIYEKPADTIEVCYMPSHEWQQTDPLQRKGTCEKTEEGWTLNYPVPFDTPPPPSKKLSNADVVTVEVGRGEAPAANAELNAWRKELESESSPAGARLRGITESHPWFQFFQFRQPAPDEYYWDFGRWWSMTPPIAGSGWRNTQWETRRFVHTASAWKNAPQSSLVFDLIPASAPYEINGFFKSFANKQLRDKMQVEVNGIHIPLQWIQDGRFSGSVPADTLKPGRNSIEFISDVDAGNGGVSAELDWINVTRQIR
ncbi:MULTISPECIES: hypothetical protein [unclassified Pseudomonas]|uniref:hypothetical protein n=1 Tax=unclassified Pseudomonas TaxID=196821 RepID=UPI000A1D5F6C|nr:MULTISPECIES: hypothetical protein [unclassified Pseudomonas]MDI2140549.1 hypothetical protein [Pseudomonas sp. ITA]